MATKAKRKASGVRRQAVGNGPQDGPYGVTVPRVLEPYEVPIPRETRCLAWVQAGKLDDGRWVVGLEAEDFRSGKHTVHGPDESQGFDTRDEAFDHVAAELYELADEDCWPPAAIKAIADFRAAQPWLGAQQRHDEKVAAKRRSNEQPPTPNPLSTTTPAGIAALDPEAQEASGVRHQASVGNGPRAVLVHEQKLAWEWKLSIDPEFKAAQRPLSNDERARLAELIAKHGCRDPIVVWESYEGLANGGKEPLRYVIDGHNRYELCQELHLPFAVVRVRLPDRAAVLEWIRTNQLARRNLSPEERDELLAREYRAEVAARREKSKVQSPESKVGAQAEPHTETVTVPFSAGHRCKASFVLLAREGRWYSFETSRSAGGGGSISYNQTSAKTLSVKDLKAHGKKSFPSRDACLRDAAGGLLKMAEGQGKKYWPAAALKELRDWKASLEAKPKKAAEVVAEKHGVSPATVKRADNAAKTKDRIARVTSRSLREIASLKPSEIVFLGRQTDDGIADALAPGIEAWRLGRELERNQESREAAKPRKKSGRAPSEIELRREAQVHIERYLNTLGAQDAWQQSGYLLDALNDWRGRNKTPQSPRRRKPK